jgi:hypothetical protein
MRDEKRKGHRFGDPLRPAFPLGGNPLAFCIDSENFFRVAWTSNKVIHRQVGGALNSTRRVWVCRKEIRVCGFTGHGGEMESHTAGLPAFDAWRKMSLSIESPNSRT